MIPATLEAALKLGNRATNVTSRYDGTALIAAAHLGHVEVVRILVKAGAPLDHVNNLGWTALIESIVLGDGGARHTATLDALVAARREREHRRSPGIVAAASRGKPRLSRDGRDPEGRRRQVTTPRSRRQQDRRSLPQRGRRCDSGKPLIFPTQTRMPARPARYFRT
jgi:ankyrin repeat protein